MFLCKEWGDAKQWEINHSSSPFLPLISWIIRSQEGFNSVSSMWIWKKWQEVRLAGDWVMLRCLSQSTLICPKQQGNSVSSWERRIFIKLEGFCRGLFCQLYTEVLLSSTRGAPVSKRQGKLVFLSTTLTWVITALSWTASFKEDFHHRSFGGWEFQNEVIKTEVIGTEIMPHSNAKPLRLAWIYSNLSPFCAWSYCENARV